MIRERCKKPGCNRLGMRGQKGYCDKHFNELMEKSDIYFKEMRFSTARKLLKEKGYTENDPRLKKLPKWLKEAYLKDIDYCEHSGCKNKDLEIHRIKRGNKGGLYIPNNVKINCKKHHRVYHSGEPGCR